jgi:hypothetical protein
LLAIPFLYAAYKIAQKDKSYFDLIRYDQVVQEWHDMFKITKPVAQWRVARMAKAVNNLPARISSLLPKQAAKSKLYTRLT